METRQKTEYRFFILNLAEMHGGVDKSVPVAVFDDIEKLKAYYNSQLADAEWKDGTWEKVFKKGSPLEWYNEPDPLNQAGNDDIFVVVSYNNAAFGGVTEEWGGEYQLTQDGWKIPLNPSPTPNSP